MLNTLNLDNGRQINQTKETIRSIKESRQRLMSPQRQNNNNNEDIAAAAN
jgi:hypothetical protein